MNTQDKIIGFAKAHGFEAIAYADTPAVVIMIPAYHRETGEREIVFEEVSTIAEARIAVGY
jgi:hypothetical protein